MLEPRDLEGRGPTQGAVHRLEPIVAESLVEVVEHLVENLGDPRNFLVCREIELSERALPQLARRAVDDRRAPRLAEDPNELERLSANPPELPRLLNDERPAHDRERHEHEEDDLGDRPRVPDESEDATTERVAH